MIRKSFFIRADQIDFIGDLPGDLSAHIRQALDEYIQKKKMEHLNVSTSPSKKGADYGRQPNNQPSPS